MDVTYLQLVRNAREAHKLLALWEDADAAHNSATATQGMPMHQYFVRLEQETAMRVRAFVDALRERNRAQKRAK